VSGAGARRDGRPAVTIDGVALLDWFDANGRDAAAQEVQDSCLGHPNQLATTVTPCRRACSARTPGRASPRCSATPWTVSAFYGPRGAHGKVLTDADLDACHGTTSMLMWNGKKVRMDHSVFTWQFPYTVGCFRGTPTSRSIFGAAGAGQNPGPAGGSTTGSATGGGPPPGPGPANP